MKLIGLCGYAGSGKDNAAEALTARGWTRVGFADAVREMAMAINPALVRTKGVTILSLSDVVEWAGWHEAKKDAEVRRLLQVIGTEAGRSILGENVWVDAAMRKVSGDTVFTDVRFPNEVAAIRGRGGFIVRIERPGVGPVNGHTSETAIDDIEPDFIIQNISDTQTMHDTLLGIVDLIGEAHETTLSV